MIFSEARCEIYREGILAQGLQKMISLAKKIQEGFVRLFAVQFWKGFFSKEETFEVRLDSEQIVSEGLDEAIGTFVNGIPHITEGIAAISLAEAWEGTSGYAKFLHNMIELQEEVKTEKETPAEKIEEASKKNTITKRNLLKRYLKFQVGDVQIDLTKISQGKIINETQKIKDAVELRRAMNTNHAICLENSRKIVALIDRQWRQVSFASDKFFPNDEKAGEPGKRSVSISFKTANPNVLATQWPTWYTKMKTIFPNAKDELNHGVKLLEDQREKDKNDPEVQKEFGEKENVPFGFISVQVHEIDGYTDHLKALAKDMTDADAKSKDKFIDLFIEEMFGKEQAIYSSLSGRKVFTKKMMDEVIDKINVSDMHVNVQGTQLIFEVSYQGKTYKLTQIAIDRSNILFKVTRDTVKLINDVLANDMTVLKDISGENRPSKSKPKKVTDRITSNRKEANKRLTNRKKSIKLVRVFAAGVSPGVKGDFVAVFKKIE